MKGLSNLHTDLIIFLASSPFLLFESFFKEAKNPFNAGKMPSEKFRGCEAYLQFVIMAVEGICTIRINANYPYKPIIKRILEDLRSLIYSQEYVSNYMKL